MSSKRSTLTERVPAGIEEREPQSELSLPAMSAWQQMGSFGTRQILPFDGVDPLAGRSIICFAHDWDGDPLSKTHIMRILARNNRILWVNSIGHRAPKATTADTARIIKKLKDATRGVVEVEP